MNQTKARSVLDFVTRAAVEILDANRVILFGSRARGDHLERSDYDFAIEPADSRLADWSRFTAEVDEWAPTLLHIDLVNLSSDVDEQLRKSIEEEGKVLHDGRSKEEMDK